MMAGGMAERGRIRTAIARLTGDGFRFFHDYVVLAGGQAISKVLGFIAFAWLARRLEPVQYGAVEYVVGLALFFALLVDGGLGTVGTRRTVAGRGEVARLAYQIRVAQTTLALIAVPAMVVIALGATRRSVPFELVLLFALSLLAVPWRQQWLFQAHERMFDNSLAEVLRMAVFAGLVLLLVRGPGDVARVGWAELAAVAATALFCIAVQHRRITPVRFRGDFSEFRGLLREGAAVGSTNLVWATSQFAPMFLLGIFIGGASLAWFGGAARIVTSLTQFSNIYHFNMFPAVTGYLKRADGSLGKVLARSLRVTGWAGALAALALVLFAHPLVRLTLGPKLPEAAPLLQIMAWMVPVTLWSGHARWVLSAAGSQTKVLRVQLAGLAVTALGSVGLGAMLGVTGYALGALAGFLTVWVGAHHFARRDGLTPPSPRLVALPLLLCGAAIAAAEATDAGWEVRLALLASVAALAPLLDRKLVADAALLGAAKRESQRRA